MYSRYQKLDWQIGTWPFFLSYFCPSLGSLNFLPRICHVHNSVVKESACSAGDPSSIPGSGRSPGEGIGYPLQYSWAFLVAQLVKNLSSVPGLGRSPEEGKGYPLQYSGPENSMDCIVHGLAKSQTRLSNFHFHSHLKILWPEGKAYRPHNTLLPMETLFPNSSICHFRFGNHWFPTHIYATATANVSNGTPFSSFPKYWYWSPRNLFRSYHLYEASSLLPSFLVTWLHQKILVSLFLFVTLIEFITCAHQHAFTHEFSTLSQEFP